MATAGAEPLDLGDISTPPDIGASTTDPRAHRSWTPLARALAAAGDRWTLMIVLQLAPGRMRLSHLQSHLPGVSTGVLERYVQQMVEIGLVNRMRFREMPPRVELELTSAGQELLPVAGALACWGMRHMWSHPREQERIDVGCLLRLLPILLDPNALALPNGSVEAVATQPGARVSYVYEIADGRVLVADGPRGTATARIEGTHGAWIAALGPDGDFGELSFSGDEQFALSVLGALHQR